MPLPPALVRHVVFPLHERLKGKATLRFLRELEASQWLEPAALAELQRERLRALLDFAAREVPFYRQRLAVAGIAPGDLSSTADLARLPCLTREDLREHAGRLRPVRLPPRVQAMRTGGSTGAPVTVLVDARRAAFTDAVRLRAHRWFGVDVGAREVVLWGSPIELGRQDRVRELRDRCLNTRLLSAFDLGDAALRRYVGVLRRVRPLKLYGYASALYRLARHLEESGWRPEPGWPRAVFATAEPLYDFQRATIQRVLGCPVAVEYGARDAGLIATECPAGGLHVAAEGAVVEIVPETAEELTGMGEIVVTNLFSAPMPLVRYRTGDLGAWDAGPCPCGRGLPRLRAVEGRRTDFLVTPDGRVMHALAAIYVIREAPGVREFQVVQEATDRVRVQVLAKPGVAGPAVRHVSEGMRRLLGDGVQVTVEAVSAIPRAASGKHRHVVSRVPLPGGSAPAPVAGEGVR